MSRTSNARIAIFVVVSFATFVALGWNILPAQAEGEASGELPATFDIDYGGKQAAVSFPHEAHFELAECVDCHHTNEGLTLENAAEQGVQKCGDCHTDPQEEGVPHRLRRLPPRREEGRQGRRRADEVHGVPPEGLSAGRSVCEWNRT